MMRNVCFRLPEETILRLNELAKVMGIRKSAIVRQAVQDFLDKSLFTIKGVFPPVGGRKLPPEAIEEMRNTA